jgi:hypothetical protein
MAITYINSLSRPADNDTANGPESNALTFGVAGVTTGDLAFIIVQYNGGGTIVMSEPNGQDWQESAIYNSPGGQSCKFIWCRWDDATETGNNPRVTTGANQQTVIYGVFRPTDPDWSWAVDQAIDTDTYTAPSTPFTVNIPGVTNSQASTVTFAVWHSEDDNTWSTPSGAGWTNPDTHTVRNNAVMSTALAYKIMTSAGATGDVSKTQDTLGGDAGAIAIISIYEFDPAAVVPVMVAWMTA